jgi:hypothetical protein
MKVTSVVAKKGVTSLNHVTFPTKLNEQKSRHGNDGMGTENRMSVDVHWMSVREGMTKKVALRDAESGITARCLRRMDATTQTHAQHACNPQPHYGSTVTGIADSAALFKKYGAYSEILY